MKIIVLIIVANSLIACSSVPSLPTQISSLSTQESNKQYYYCESCNIPTELSTQVYKPLEPDTIIEPVIKPIPIISTSITERLTLRKKKGHKIKIHRIYKLKHKLKPKTKQCIEWSK